MLSFILPIVMTLTSLGLQQSEEGVQNLLRNVSNAYRDLWSYYYEGMISTQVKDRSVHQKIMVPIVIAEAKPSKREVIHPEHPPLRLMVSFGRPIFEVQPVEIRMPSLWHFEYGQIAERVKTFKIVRQESIEVSGESVECYVIEVVYAPETKAPDAGDSPALLWIDKSRLIVLRHTFHVKGSLPGIEQGELSWTATFTTIRLNEPIPPDVLARAPSPETLKRVARVAQEKASYLIGTIAPDFTLKDLRGKEFSLSNLRGKVVLLYFWATWCGPCREEMARLEKLHREFQTRGLVVLGITAEAPGVVRDFLDKNKYTFPILVDTSRRVWQQYQVEIIPVTIVVDREGKIVSYDIEARGERELRTTIEKAGLGAKGRAHRVGRF